MKILKLLLIGLLLLVGAYLIMSIFGPKRLDTSRSIVINAPVEKVFAIAADFNQWPKWSPWQLRDTQMKNTVIGDPMSLGHKMSWESETQGSGEQEIVEIVQNSMVKTSLKFKGWDQTSYAAFILLPEGEGTKLTWTMEGGEVPFMMRGMMVAFGAVGAMEKDYDEGLAGIKKLAEQ